MKKFVLFCLIVFISMLGIAKANAHTVPFKKYTTDVTWYKAGGTLQDIWPQNLTVIDCGGIKQHDYYTITSAKMDADFKKLLARGILNSPADDAEFNVHDWTVDLLPACIPPKPDDIHGGDSSQNCDGVTTREWHHSWEWNGTDWVATEKVYDVNEHRPLTHQEALDEGCITDEPTPSDTPTTEPPTSDTPSTTPPVVKTTDPGPTHSVTHVKPAVKSTPVASLANTGADSGDLLSLFLVLVALGVAVLFLSHWINRGRRQ